MSQTDLNRLRGDLDVIRTVVGAKLPFGPADIRLNLIVAGLGAVLMAWCAWALGKHPYFTAMPIIAVLLGVVALQAVFSHRYGTQKSMQPTRANLIGCLLLFALAIGLFFYALGLGIAFNQVMGLALAAAGLTGLGVFPLLDRARRYYLLAQAGVIMLYGLAICADGNYIGIATGGWLALSGVLTAAIMSAQIRAAGVNHAHD